MYAMYALYALYALHAMHACTYVCMHAKQTRVLPIDDLFGPANAATPAGWSEPLV